MVYHKAERKPLSSLLLDSTLGASKFGVLPPFLWHVIVFFFLLLTFQEVVGGSFLLIRAADDPHISSPLSFKKDREGHSRRIDQSTQPFPFFLPWIMSRYSHPSFSLLI